MPCAIHQTLASPLVPLPCFLVRCIVALETCSCVHSIMSTSIYSIYNRPVSRRPPGPTTAVSFSLFPPFHPHSVSTVLYHSSWSTFSLLPRPPRMVFPYTVLAHAVPSFLSKNAPAHPCKFVLHMYLYPVLNSPASLPF